MEHIMKKRRLQLAARIFLASLVCFILLLAYFNHPENDAPASGTESGSVSSDSGNSELESDHSELESDISEDESKIPETESETETPGSSQEPEDKKELSYLEQCELDYVEPPVKRDLEQAFEKIREMSLYYPLLHIVYDNREQYNISLIMALAGNPEMTDFAAGLLTREHVVTGGFRDDEVPEDYPLFLQWDIRWGYMPYGSTGGNMGSSGCGPTCLSMAVFYLTGDRTCTPDVVAKYSEDHGYYIEGAGTAWSLLYDYPTLHGLTSVAVGRSESRFKSELDKGNILICSVREGNFTTGGHFILIYGYDENGFKVNDPKCIYRSRLSWTYQQIKNDIKQTWSIGKP
ncbi:MAG: hypothetical protein E7283_02255 [Lachnospiraceae bacterium]|nr:hypothetical protein [Lachnospiraceae bacterium]